ncbi:hypothetical protein GCM10011579_033440 [Streptomyces albiflavescens]|uniref:Uncharacterized protein n=1 Tax=Streptomyces albiflavescens TaxID=1623582 RepID=A0A917Y1V3_9ACTN|nr:hypothetical protein GCM10011579_033440 [Streptomyces albiflavescens]
MAVTGAAAEGRKLSAGWGPAGLCTGRADVSGEPTALTGRAGGAGVCGSAADRREGRCDWRDLAGIWRVAAGAGAWWAGASPGRRRGR